LDRLPNRSAEPRMRDYAEEAASFRLEVPEVFNPVLDIVDRWADEAPQDLALVSLDAEGGVVAEQTAADLARESRRAARALLDAGIGKGDRVFIMLPRVPAWYTAMLGAIRIGAVVMPAPNMLTPRDIGYRIGTAGAVAAITDAGGGEGWLDLDALLDEAGDGEEGDAELAKELQDFAKNLTAPYKYPREIHFVKELPKTISGKIRRSELREQLAAGAFD
jgi:acyl-coenzyme A synthetase/AMP-(fatty) acid ligase